MSEIKLGSKVKVHYVGKLKDGKQFDSSLERKEPLEFTIGDERMLIDFENTVRTMKVGEKKSVDIPKDRAYGEIKSEAEIKVPRADFPEDFRYIIDERIQGKTKNGEGAQATIVEVTKDEVTLDMNHPLAGHDLNFEIELLEIEK
jgi:FKBP-type peptidyl-prolyl cis-trans isomerase 2